MIPTTAADLDEALEMGMDWSVREGYAWAEDKEHCEEFGRMLNADPSKVPHPAPHRPALPRSAPPRPAPLRPTPLRPALPCPALPYPALPFPVRPMYAAFHMTALPCPV